MKDNLKDLRWAFEADPDVIEELRCPVCKGLMCPPVKIYACSAGHNIFETCYEHVEVTTCHTCRRSIKKNVMRVRSLEKIAKSIYKRVA